MNFPNELLLKIFSYLDTSIIASKIQLVCKSWKSVSEDASLWKSVLIKGTRNVRHISSVIAKYPSLQSLTIEKGLLNSTIFKALTLLSQLRTLKLYECTFFMGSKTAFSSLMNLSLLKSLELRKCWVDSIILDITSEAKSLRRLKVTYLENYNLAKILDNCDQLEELEINQIDNLSEDILERIFQLRSKTLISVSLHGEKSLSDAIFSHLEHCSLLSKLYVRRCSTMTDYTLSRIGKLHSLQFLEIGFGVKFSAFGLLDLFSQPFVRNLVCLDLMKCANLDDNCVYTIADKCKQLQKLCLQGCERLTDKSVVVVARKCVYLSTLDLSWIHQLKGLFFEDLIINLKELKTLDLRMCQRIEKSRIKMLMLSRSTLVIYKSWQ